MGSNIRKIKSKQSRFFPKQFTVGVLNATLDLAALVLVGVAAFLGSAVVLAPFGSLYGGGGCWLVWPPSCALKWSWLPLAPFVWGWVLDGVAAFCGLSSGLGLPLAPFLWC